MPRVVIQYKHKKTLQALQDIAKYFDYRVSPSQSEDQLEERTQINGVTIVPANSSVDISDMSRFFTGKNINPELLRTEQWQRKK